MRRGRYQHALSHLVNLAATTSLPGRRANGTKVRRRWRTKRPFGGMDPMECFFSLDLLSIASSPTGEGTSCLSLSFPSVRRRTMAAAGLQAENPLRHLHILCDTHLCGRGYVAAGQAGDRLLPLSAAVVS